MKETGLTFGIYPLSPAGTPVGLAVGPEDDFIKINAALNSLRKNEKKLIPRNYLVYMGPEKVTSLFLAAERYGHAGLLGDLTVGCMQESPVNLDAWLEFLRKIIQKYGKQLQSLQITNEPNLSFMEGAKPYVMEVLIEGVKTAKKEALARNCPIKIGFGSVPDSPAAISAFWEKLGKQGGKSFVEAVDFVGHNFYVDVFEEPMDLEEIPLAVETTLRNLRDKYLPQAGIHELVPIRVTENGWPTGKNPFLEYERTYEHQAQVLEKVIRTINNLRQQINITHYELFGLRDADSSKDDLFHQFGILKDDYSPKPGFYTFKKLLQELGN
ncbi:hypothetical protein [Heyndrickxia acidicola]|uniref:Uncharacterized protein n=1 Tax=Heyndrickxia acidicola TaxID=209389 RepID=A0ABU6MH28_9BACI|nr:hypothetical protein [Heyndrickxia acidicola]MED1203981.1 hypothetical protein [Heyndrickxia acidicola]